jgi:hypothetical protein
LVGNCSALIKEGKRYKDTYAPTKGDAPEKKRGKSGLSNLKFKRMNELSK